MCVAGNRLGSEGGEVMACALENVKHLEHLDVAGA